jgi:hypothetical protein
VPGDRHGSVNPVRSKTKQEAKGGPSARRFSRVAGQPPGRSHEACGNVRPRWMVAAPRCGGTESGLQAGSHYL